jgi:alkaline phosphatase
MKRALAVLLVLLAAAAAGWLAGAGEAGAAGMRLVRVESAAVGPATPPPAAPPALPDGPVRNLVLIVGDGMGLAQSAAARIRLLGADGRFLFERLPVTGLVETHPALGLITRSDAAATALASGAKTINGRLGESPAGRALPSLLERARDAGLVTGLVTTSEIVDATPAAFAAHVGSRYDYAEIGRQMAAAGVDLLAGGGREKLAPHGLGEGPLAEAAARGVAVVTDVAGLAAADRLPLWAVFPGHQLGEEPRHPDLRELAERALDLLGAEAHRRARGFFLVLEEEGVDTAGHARSFERLAAAVARLDRAVDAAVRFATADGATLVLVVGDHATGGLEIDHSSTRERLSVVWASSRHSGEPVPIYAYGPRDAELAFTGLHDNTEIHDLIAAALGLDRVSAAETSR